MNTKERNEYWNKGARMNSDEIKNTIENLSAENQKEAIWYLLKGVIQSPGVTAAEQCLTMRELRLLLNGNLASFFNMTNVPGSEHGERLLQHAISYKKDELVLAILEEPEISVSFESSELRSTPLLLALMNGLSHDVIQKLTTEFSIKRKNTQNSMPEDIAKTTGNSEFLTLLASRKAVMDGASNFFQPHRITDTPHTNTSEKDGPSKRRL